MSKEFSPFDFMNAASDSKKDIIRESENPDLAEKEYSSYSYVVNRGFSYFEDTILHANEMNIRWPMLDNMAGAQFDYYRASLRKRKRFSKWHKAEPNEDLFITFIGIPDYMTEDEIVKEINQSKNLYSYLKEPNKYAEVVVWKDLSVNTNAIFFFIKNNSTNKYKYVTDKNEKYKIMICLNKNPYFKGYIRPFLL